MPETVHSLMPDPEGLLSLEPEELAGIVLEVIHSKNQVGESLNRLNFTLQNNFASYPRQYQERVAQAVMEAWIWLEREGLIAPNPGDTGSWYFVTRRGEKITNRTDLGAYRKANLLPRKQLHPIIAQKVWATFLRGDYDIAVFQSFKEVEVAVREAGKYADSDIGTKLMRKAFDVNSGELTDQDREVGERQAMSDLFAGSIGLYKNPPSHRNISISPDEAVETIMLASHLLRIIELRGKKS